MNGYLKGYRLFAWIGILENLSFAASAFCYPALLIQQVAGGRAEMIQGPWLFNTAMLLLLGAAFYLPAAQDPTRDPLYSRLTGWARVFASVSWIVYLLTAGAGLPSGFWTFPLADGLLGIMLLALLRLGLPRRV